MSFVDLFGDDLDAEPPPEPPEAHERPIWLGPPEGELGIAVPLALVLARSDRAVVALSHALAYSTGVSLQLVAHVEGLERRRAHLLFHEQHGGQFDDDELPDGFLRLGVELPDGRRASNLGRRRPFPPPDAAPPGPVLLQHGGGGGGTSGTSISLHPAYWLWPLPGSGTLRVYCEWPVAGIALSDAAVDADALVDAASRSTSLWEHPTADGPWTRSISTMSAFAASDSSDAPATGDEPTLAVSAAELRAVRESLQNALRALRRLSR